MTSKRNKVSDKQTINRAVNWVDSALLQIIESGRQAYVEVGVFDENRSNPQNAKIHAMIGDINKMAVIALPGRRVAMSDYDPDACKALLVVWFANERELDGRPLPKPPRTITDPITGLPVTLRPSTTEFGKKNMAEFVEWLYAFGTTSGVLWSEPAIREYQNYKEAQQ